MTPIFDDEDSPWDDIASEFDGPEDDERKVDAWKDVPLADLLQDISNDIREIMES